MKEPDNLHKHKLRNNLSFRSTFHKQTSRS